eukprot:COSAG04_NODE_435_length_14466_cov_135.545486_2_plen_99_part_00
MNLFVQLRGRKRFWLLPPAATLQLPLEPAHSPGHRQLKITPPSQPEGGEQCTDSLPERALMEALPAELRHQVIVAELGPGEMLWLPACVIRDVRNRSE